MTVSKLTWRSREEPRSGDVLEGNRLRHPGKVGVNIKMVMMMVMVVMEMVRMIYLGDKMPSGTGEVESPKLSRGAL